MKPAFSNARIEARLRTSGSARQACVSARAKTTSETKVRITWVPRPDPVRLASPRKMSSPAASVARIDERRVLGVVGEKVRLNEPDALAGDDDRVEVGRIAALDCGQVLGDRLVVAPGLAPPAAHVLSPEPVVEQRQITDRERTKADVHLGPPGHAGATAGSSAARSRRDCCCCATDAPAPANDGVYERR